MDANGNFYVTFFLYYRELSRQENNFFTYCRAFPQYGGFNGQDLEYFLAYSFCCRGNTR